MTDATRALCEGKTAADRTGSGYASSTLVYPGSGLSGEIIPLVLPSVVG